MKTASRTLMKSSPELWEMLDTPERMHGLMCSLVGQATEIEVSEREPETRLAWKTTSHLYEAQIEVDMAEKGWGTHVEVSASCKDEVKRLDGWLDAVMEELATPEKRPFGGVA